MKVGDPLSLTGPYGSFTIKDGHVLPIVCIGGGAGMAPILSLLRHLSESANTRPVHFYYGARTARDLFYLNEILELGTHLKDFRFVACLSEVVDQSLPGSELPDSVTVEEGNVTDVVDRSESELGKSEVYLCGPPPMVDAALALLDANGVPKDQVFYDKFTSPAFD